MIHLLGSLLAARNSLLRLLRLLLARSLTRWCACSLACCLLPACASSPPARSFEVPLPQSSAAFAAAMDELRERRFVPERVDAQAGIITTQPKRTGGLASPWDLEQSTLAQDFEDTLHFHTRTVEVRFHRASPPDGLTDASRAMWLDSAPLTCEVEVFVARRQTPNMQAQARVIGLSSQTIDPTLATRGMAFSYTTSLSRDDAFAARIASAIAQRLD